MKLVILLLFVMPLAIIAAGTWQILEQQRKLTSYVEGKGEVVEPRPEVRVRTSSGKNRSTTYTPVVHYRFEAGGSIYRAERVFPVSNSASRKVAYEIVNQFGVGRGVKVYYDPADPGQSFLVRRREFSPYMMVLFPMILLAAGVGTLASGAGRGERAWAREAIQTRDGWFELPPKLPLRRRRRLWMTVTGLWWGVGLAACGHYFVASERPYATDAQVVTAIYFAIGLVLLVFAVRQWMLARNAGDARVLVDRFPVRTGQTLDVRVEQGFYRHLLIESASVGLVLERTQETRSSGKVRVETIKVGEQWADDLVKNEQAGPGRPIKMKHRFTVPADEPPSSDPEEKGYPRHGWFVMVKVKIADSPDYSGGFWVKVVRR